MRSLKILKKSEADIYSCDTFMKLIDLVAAAAALHVSFYGELQF